MCAMRVFIEGEEGSMFFGSGRGVDNCAYPLVRDTGADVLIPVTVSSGRKASFSLHVPGLLSLSRGLQEQLVADGWKDNGYYRQFLGEGATVQLMRPVKNSDTFHRIRVVAVLPE